MSRRKFGKLAFAILSLFFIFIFVKRDTQDVVIEPTTSSSSPSSRKSTSHRVVNKPISSMKDFCVFDHKCRIPRVNPFSADVMQIFNPPKFKECTDQPDLVSVRYDREKRQYIVNINESLFLNVVRFKSDYSCVYFELMFEVNKSSMWKIGPYDLKQNWIVPRRIQAIIVECSVNGNESRVLQRNAFALVQYPDDRNDQVDRERSRTHPSVIMLGIDSMSQMNFQRTMPLTAQFVRQPGWHEMLGYNKIGDNSLPNMLPLLTGLTAGLWRAKCDVQEPGCLDSFTYLWNHFQNAGYLTAYAEDTPSIETFHYFVSGFQRKPVDYYLRPFLLAFQKLLDTVKYLGYEYCLGRRQSYRYVYDYCLQLVERFVHETPKPLFGLFWTNGFSHDDFSGAVSVDRDFVSYLQRFKELGLFERAVVILVSDHGQRQGPLMELSSSFMEERLPMLHIYLPPWYRKRYPDAVGALDMNRRRLSSTIDLHLTVQHLLQPGLKTKSPCLTCQSLLRPVPVNRSCADAAIPEHWCTCEPYVQVPLSDLIKHWASVVVYRINIYLVQHNCERKCYRLRLAKLQRAERRQHFDDEDRVEVGPANGIETFRIKFTTYPNGGLFRATFFVHPNSSLQVSEEFITRLNSYRNESFCVSKRNVKMFCACLKAQINFDDDIDINDRGTPG